MCFCKVKSGLVMTSSEKRMFGLNTRLESNVFELPMQYLFREGVCSSFVQVFDSSSGSVDSFRGDKSSSVTYSSKEKLERTTIRELGMITAVCLMYFRDSIDATTSSFSNMYK